MAGVKSRLSGRIRQVDATPSDVNLRWEGGVAMGPRRLGLSEDRAIPGHRGGDLLAGGKNSYMATLVERHSRFLMLVERSSCLGWYPHFRSSAAGSDDLHIRRYRKLLVPGHLQPTVPRQRASQGCRELRTRSLNAETTTAVSLLSTLNILAGCTAGPNQFKGTATEHNVVAGFWLGLWQGFIAPFVLVASLFKGSLNIYELHNNGAWYNFGYLIGLACFFGGGGHGSARRK